MKILLVDSDMLMLKALEVKLRNEGYDVISCTDGKEALTKMDTEQPEIVITDIMLSGASGFEILRAAKEKEYPVLVIVVSVIGQEKVVEEAFELGANDYVPKPYNLSLFVNRIKRLISNHRHMSMLAEAIPISERISILKRLAEKKAS